MNWIDEHYNTIVKAISTAASLDERCAAQQSAGILASVLQDTMARLDRAEIQGARAALMDIVATLRTVYPELAFSSRSSSAAQYVRRLVRDLEDTKRALARARANQKEFKPVSLSEVHAPGCSAERCAVIYGPNGPFVCRECRRIIGYCMESRDWDLNICDDCAEKQSNWSTSDIVAEV
jgi:hypothetical protein